MINRRTLLSATAAASFMAYAPAIRAQDVRERTIRLGHLNDPGNPISLGVAKFAELVSAKSGGKLKIREFGVSQLGNEMQQQSAMMGGVQEMFVSAPTSLNGIVKEFGLLDLPYIFASREHATAVLDGPFGALLLSRLAQKGIVGLAYWDLGFRNLTNSRRPVAKLEDFNGLKLRVIGNAVYLETFRTLGANPVPMAMAEVYVALEQKVVDGQENPFAVIRSAKLYEVQKYLSVTNHTYTTNLLQVGKVFWDKLSPTEQGILRDAANESLAYQRQASISYGDKALEEIKAKGMLVNDVPAAERERMRQATLPVAEKFLAEYEAEAVKLFRSELERNRK